MSSSQVLGKLEALGTAQNRRVYARHGVGPDMYGVSYADLNKLKKQIKTDHDLALELWESGNHDARVLACMIADPKKTDGKLLDGWIKDLENYVLTDAFSKLAAASPQAGEKYPQWAKSPQEWRGRAAFSVLSHLAMRDKALDEGGLAAWIERIEKEIHQRPNRTRDAMLGAVAAIGLRNETLEERALQAADRIGHVEVDHGETSCKTIDIRETLSKARAHRRKRLARK